MLLAAELGSFLFGEVTGRGLLICEDGTRSMTDGLCIFQQARDRYLASGFGHAMGFDSPAGLPM